MNATISTQQHSPVMEQINSIYSSCANLHTSIASLNEKLQLVIRPIPVREEPKGKENTNASILVNHLKTIDKQIMEFNFFIMEIIGNIDL